MLKCLLQALAIHFTESQPGWTADDMCGARVGSFDYSVDFFRANFRDDRARKALELSEWERDFWFQSPPAVGTRWVMVLGAVNLRLALRPVHARSEYKRVLEY